MASRGLAAMFTSLLLCGAVFAQANSPPQSTSPPALPDAPSQALELPQPPVPVPPSTMMTVPASSVYVPLTPRQKFDFFLRHTYSPYTFASAAMGASYSQATGDMKGYGGGMEGWGKRFGAAVADTEARTFLGTFLFPTLFRQDPRYFAKRSGSFFDRGWYAATRVLVTRADNGRNTFNLSEVASVAASKTLCNAYYPESNRGVGVTISRIAGALGSDAGTYVLREFSPEIKQLLRRIVPKRLEKASEKGLPQ